MWSLKLMLPTTLTMALDMAARKGWRNGFIALFVDDEFSRFLFITRRCWRSSSSSLSWRSSAVRTGATGWVALPVSSSSIRSKRSAYFIPWGMTVFLLISNEKKRILKLNLKKCEQKWIFEISWLDTKNIRVRILYRLNPRFHFTRASSP